MGKCMVCGATLMILLMGNTSGLAQNNPSLMGYWKFDGDTLDSSGNGRTGTLVGDATFAAGFDGQALSLDGSGDYVTINNYTGVLGGNPFTITAWVNATDTGDRTIVCWGSSTNGQRVDFRMFSGRLRVEHGNGNLQGNTPMNDGEWHHVACVVGQNARIQAPDVALYLDGVNDSQTTTDPDTFNITSSVPVTIGQRRTSNDRAFMGRIDEVRVYDRVLTADEIAPLAARTRAWKPKPADGQLGVVNPLLEWTGSPTAIFYNVYFGVTPELTEADRVAAQQPFTIYFHMQPLVPGTTYYWRVDEIEGDLTTVHTGDLWSFMVNPLTAWAPAPADDGASVLPAPTLKWSAGQQALQHHVYFSSSFADVNDGAAAADQGLLTVTQFKTPLLRSSTTYFWRVDEVLVDGTVQKGEVWDFTTQPAVRSKIVRQWWTGIGGTAVTNLTGSANYPDKPTGTELLDFFEGPTGFADNYGSRLFGWLTPPATGEYTFWIASDDGSELHLSTDADPANATTVAFTTAWTNSQEWTKYATQKSAPISLKAGQKYFIEALQKDGTGGDNIAVSWQGPGIEAQQIITSQYVDAFALLPLEAFDPKPANGAVDVVEAPVLSWGAGEKARQHEVYFGDDATAVAAADATSPLFKGRQDAMKFEPGVLEWNRTYYWRVDEVNPAEAGSPWKGNVWSFTTANFIPIDDFESYTDEEGTGGRIYETWIDGYVDQSSGSTVGNLNAPFAERTIVHGGLQSMPMDYNNTNSPFYSEAEREFAPVQNWTVNGVDTLSLWFRGNPVSFQETASGITLSAGGNDIWNTADAFRYAYKRLSGNGSITVKVESLVNSNGWAKAGVMIRETLDAGSPHAAVVITPANGVSFPSRDIAGGASIQINQTGVAAPYWVRITRTGNTFKAEHSADGVAWSSVGTDPVASSKDVVMGNSVYIGLCLTSHNVNAATTAVFSNITTSGNVSGAWQAVPIGVDPQFGNSPEKLYVTVADSANKSVTIVHPDPAAVTATDWTEWTIPLSDLTGVSLSKVKRLTVGVGDRQSPAPGGAGRIYLDDIRVTRP